MSKKNQNFNKNPDMQIIQSILETFGLDNLEDDRFIKILNCFGIIDFKDKKEFTKSNLEDLNIICKIEDLIPELVMYYLPCKSKIYLNELTEKKCITILRQFVKNYNYKVIGIEKSIKGNKTTTYRLIYVNQEYLSPKKEPDKQRKYVVSFDT